MTFLCLVSRMSTFDVSYIEVVLPPSTVQNKIINKE